jgi:hypothetical protein
LGFNKLPPLEILVGFEKLPPLEGWVLRNYHHLRYWLGLRKLPPLETLGFEKLPVEDEYFAGLLFSRNLRMQDEWQFFLALHLHPGGQPLFVPGCRCRSRKDWACS